MSEVEYDEVEQDDDTIEFAWGVQQALVNSETIALRIETGTQNPENPVYVDPVQIVDVQFDPSLLTENERDQVQEALYTLGEAVSRVVWSILGTTSDLVIQRGLINLAASLDTVSEPDSAVDEPEREPHEWERILRGWEDVADEPDVRPYDQEAPVIEDIEREPERYAQNGILV